MRTGSQRAMDIDLSFVRSAINAGSAELGTQRILASCWCRPSRS